MKHLFFTLMIFVMGAGAAMAQCTIDVDTNGKDRNTCLGNSLNPEIIFNTEGATNATVMDLPNRLY